MKAIIQRDDFWSDLVNGLFLRPVYRRPRAAPESETVSDQSTSQHPNDVGGKTAQSPTGESSRFQKISNDGEPAAPLFTHRDRKSGPGLIFPQIDDGTFTFDKTVSLWGDDEAQKSSIYRISLGTDALLRSPLKNFHSHSHFYSEWYDSLIFLGLKAPTENVAADHRVKIYLYDFLDSSGLDLDHTVGEVVAELKEDSAVSKSQGHVPGGQGK